MLNRDDPETEVIIIPSPEFLDIDTDPPNVEEVKRAIKALKDGKTPGKDQIYAEMLKADLQITATLLTDILRDIWESEEAPLSWKTGLIVKLPKKGDLTNCNNWRGIIFPGGDSHMEQTGMLVGNFEPLKETIWAWLKLFVTPKGAQSGRGSSKF